MAFGNELNLANNQVLKHLREAAEYQNALSRNGVTLDELELEIKEWFREYIKPAESYQHYLSLANPSLEQDFEVVDDLSNSLMSVNTIGGLPVFEVFANNSIIAGQYNANDFVILGNKVGIGTNIIRVVILHKQLNKILSFLGPCV